MPSVSEFKSALVQEGRDFLGLCMFAPVAVAPAVNRRLNVAYNDSGDNLSLPMGRGATSDVVEYVAGNHSVCGLSYALATIDIFGEVPGCVLLVAEPGIGQQSTPAIGLVEHGRVVRYLGEPSFYSFANNYLGLTTLINTLDDLGKELKYPSVQIVAVTLTPRLPQQFMTVPWDAIVRRILNDPESLYDFAKDARGFEEFIAETYARAGFKVELTPRSGDGGVDVIAELPGHGAIKILEQTKAYSAHNLVPADDVRAAAGVLLTNHSASKVVVTTTSDFAPGVFDEFSHMTPTRLELRSGHELIEWLKTLPQT